MRRANSATLSYAMIRKVEAAIFFSVVILSLAVVTPLTRAAAADNLQLAANEIKAKDFAAAKKHLELALIKDPSSAEAYNLLGICQLAAGDKVTAKKSFEEATHLNPQLPAAHVNLGYLILRSGNRKASLKEFEAALVIDPRALTQDPSSFQGFNLLGLCLMDEHKYDDAGNAFEHSVAINPQYSPAYVNLGNALVAQHRDDEALKAFRRALTLRSEDPLALYETGLIYARQQNFDQAAQFLRRAHVVSPLDFGVTAALAGVDIQQGERSEAEALTAELIERRNLTSSMRLSLAVSWLQNGEPTQAVPLVKNDPRLAAQFYQLGYEKAEALFEESHYSQAAQVLGTIQDLEPPTARLYGLLGSIDYKLGKPQQASDNLQKAIRLNPSDPEYYFRLGMVFLKHHTPKPAIYIFRTALQSESQSAMLWFGLGMSYYFASDTVHGEQALRKAIELAPDYEVAYIVLGDLLDQTGRSGEAAANFQEAIRLQPHSYLPYYFCGVVTSRLGKNKLSTAIVMLRKAVLLNPGFAKAHYELGKSLWEEGQMSEAIAELKKSIKLEPDLARAHYQLGRIYEKLGKSALAREQFRVFAMASEKEDSHDLIRRLVVQIGTPAH